MLARLICSKNGTDASGLLVLDNTNLLEIRAGVVCMTFKKPGTYDYQCILHSGMTWEVVVKSDLSENTSSSVVIQAQAKCSTAIWFSTFFSHLINNILRTISAVELMHLFMLGWCLAITDTRYFRNSQIFCKESHRYPKYHRFITHIRYFLRLPGLVKVSFHHFRSG